MNSEKSLEILPNELISLIMKYAHFDSIKSLHLTCSKFNKLCESKEVRYIIISRLHENLLDLSDFTFNELMLYSKVLPLKRKINLRGHATVVNQLIINLGYKCLEYNQHSDKSNNKFVQIYPGRDKVMYSGWNSWGNKDMYVMLGKDGKFRYKQMSDVLDEVTNIYPDPDSDNRYDKDSDNDNLFITTRNGDLYRKFKFSLFKLEGINNIIQIKGHYCLTSQGHVYVEEPQYVGDVNVINFSKSSMKVMTETENRNNKVNMNYIKLNNLPKMVEITKNGILLSEEGNVYIVDFFDRSINLIDNLHNIIQICGENIEMMHVLDNRGNVYNIKGEKISILSNISEICVNNNCNKYCYNCVFALDDKNVLHICNLDPHKGPQKISYDLSEY